MSILYVQRAPQLQLAGRRLFFPGQPLYSGHGDGLNNPDMERIRMVGPIPAGRWRIEEWLDHHPTLGPVVAILVPLFDPYGRSAFRIHGDNPAANNSASDGCIVAGPDYRKALRSSGETDLEVAHANPAMA